MRRPPASRRSMSGESAAIPGRGKHDDHGGEDGAEDEAPILRERLQLILQQRERQRPDDRTEEIGEAAEHRHEHELARMRPVHQLGVGEADAEAEDGAADGTVDRRDDERGEPELAHVHAEILGLRALSRSARRCSPNGRMHDAPHHQRGDAPAAPGNSSRRGRRGARSCCRRRTPGRGCACAAPACRCRRRSGDRT